MCRIHQTFVWINRNVSLITRLFGPRSWTFPLHSTMRPRSFPSLPNQAPTTFPNVDQACPASRQPFQPPHETAERPVQLDMSRPLCINEKSKPYKNTIHFLFTCCMCVWWVAWVSLQRLSYDIDVRICQYKQRFYIAMRAFCVTRSSPCTSHM